jgi:sec-independent protein translocase protein TatA
MELLAPRHLLLILLVCLLVFGTKKLKTIGSDLGGALRDFKKAMANDAAPDTGPATQPAAPASIADQREKGDAKTA